MMTVIKTILQKKVYILVVAMSLLSQLSQAENTFMDDWHINGSNTLRGSFYDAYGPGAASPYPFEGGMLFNEFNVYLNKRNTRYDSMRAEISGLVNVDDEYRATNNSVVPERMSFVRENGETDIPYRIEAGDHFAYYSYLTLQRSLKGLQLEFQPVSDVAGRKHSIVVTMGADQSNWRDLKPDDDFTTGFSWLMQDRLLGALGFNFVHNTRDKSATAGTLGRQQYVASLTGEKVFDTPQYKTVFEAELAHFAGDHNGVAGAASGQGRSENGYFMQLSGQSKLIPWDYRLRIDHYGQDFRPRGAIVTADRRSIELHSGWLHQSGVRTRGRIQFFQDGFETTNKTSTRTYGINFSGPLLKNYYPDVNGTVDAFIQNRDNDSGTVNTNTKNFNMSLTKPLRGGWSGRGSLFIQNIDDESTTNADTYTRQLGLNGDHSIEIAGFKGVITPGILLRTVRRGSNYSTDFNPTLALSLTRGAHALRFDYGSEFQNRDLSISGADINTHKLNLDYRYTNGQQVFGLEGNLFDRDTRPGESTQAYRLSAYWTYNFDKPPTALARAATPIGGQQAAKLDIQATIAGLVPGATEDKVLAALSRARITGGVEQAGYVVYETPLLSEIFRRQRLVLEFAAGNLERSALLIDFDNVGDRDTVMQTFEKIRQTLIRQLGNPSRTIQNGDFTASFVADVNSQQLIRIVEWSTPYGVIRFGIPRRLDGHVRMEIQYGRIFPPTSETLWSIENVR